jgi:hypothetical protein
VPQSDFVSLAALLRSPHQQLRKFRESVFLGEVQEGRRHGSGIMLYTNGRVYEG